MVCNSCWSFAAHGIGCTVMVWALYQIVQWLYVTFLRAGKNLKQFGEWAIVTGATDGIGKAVALELARKGLKVLLISRSQERLDETKGEVEKVFKSDDAKSKVGCCETLALDMSVFGSGDKAAKSKMEAAIKGKNVAVLVNNVGISYDHPEFLHELDDDRIDMLINLNVGATTRITKMVVADMVKKEAKSAEYKGLVVSIATSGCVAPCPLLSVYAASKAFVQRFSQSLDGEYPKIHFQVQPVHFVTTKLAKIRNPSLTTPTPNGFARSCVSAMGYEREISPYWSHYAVVGVIRRAPSEILDRVVMWMHLGLRSRALKKKAENAKKQ